MESEVHRDIVSGWKSVQRSPVWSLKSGIDISCMDWTLLPVGCSHYVCWYTLCVCCGYLLTRIVCIDTDKWRCTLSSVSQRLNPSWLSLLIAPSYYLSVKKRGGGPASVCQKTIYLHRDPVLSPGCDSYSLSYFLTLWTPLPLTTHPLSHHNFSTPNNLHIRSDGW